MLNYLKQSQNKLRRRIWGRAEVAQWQIQTRRMYRPGTTNTQSGMNPIKNALYLKVVTSTLSNWRTKNLTQNLDMEFVNTSWLDILNWTQKPKAKWSRLTSMTSTSSNYASTQMEMSLSRCWPSWLPEEVSWVRLLCISPNFLTFCGHCNQATRTLLTIIKPMLLICVRHSMWCWSLAWKTRSRWTVLNKFHVWFQPLCMTMSTLECLVSSWSTCVMRKPFDTMTYRFWRTTILPQALTWCSKKSRTGPAISTTKTTKRWDT